MLREAADVVVALDDGARVAVDGDALNDVRVGGALREEGHVGDVRAGVVEHLDELAADDLALAFGLVDAGELREEAVGGVDVDERHLEGAAEELADAFRLVLAEQAIVHEDAGELVADRLVDERGGHGGIDAAGEAEDHVRGADGRADLRHGAFDEVGHGPVGGAAADAEAEIFDDERAHRGVDDLGVELDAEEAAVEVLHGGELGVVGLRARLEALGQARDLVAVGHPHLGLGGDVLEERRGCRGGDDGLAIFAGVAVRHFTAERLDHELEAVADAQHRDAEAEDGGVAFRGVRLVDARGAAAQDDARGRGGADLFRRSLPGDDPAVDVEFADAPCDELAVLGSEIQHENGFRMVHNNSSQRVRKKRVSYNMILNRQKIQSETVDFSKNVSVDLMRPCVPERIPAVLPGTSEFRGRYPGSVSSRPGAEQRDQSSSPGARPSRSGAGRTHVLSSVTYCPFSPASRMEHITSST